MAALPIAGVLDPLAVADFVSMPRVHLSIAAPALPAIFPLSDGSDSGTPIAGFRRVQRPHGVRVGVESPWRCLPALSCGKAPFTRFPSLERHQTIARFTTRAIVDNT
jgi:hypothetical protein